jgi:hypothetical protein
MQDALLIITIATVQAKWGLSIENAGSRSTGAEKIVFTVEAVLMFETSPTAADR